MILDHETFSIERQTGYIVGTFHHNVDMEMMLRLKPQMERILPQIDAPLILDLGAVHFLDSSAVGIIALLFRHTQSQDRMMMIAAANPQPDAVLSMVGLSDYVPLFPTLEEAVAALKHNP